MSYSNNNNTSAAATGQGKAATGGMSKNNRLAKLTTKEPRSLS
jgi:hypothetical protein